MTNFNLRQWPIYWGALVVMALFWAPSASACQAMAATAMEKAYCEVMAKGEGQGLPSFDDFRRNPESTQRLLLKRPAKRAGVALPESSPSPKQASPSASHKAATNNAPVNNTASKPAQTNTTRPQASGLVGCEVNQRALNCGGAVYQLLDNKSNASLADGALANSNQLQLPPVPAYKSERELHRYLMHAYSIYIAKMDSIGLAGNTLSYSKFYYIFEDVKAGGQNFVARFANMFTYLKKDKSTIAVGRSHTAAQTPNIQYCERIHGDLITCDDHGRNWVYRR